MAPLDRKLTKKQQKNRKKLGVAPFNPRRIYPVAMIPKYSAGPSQALQKAVAAQNRSRNTQVIRKERPRRQRLFNAVAMGTVLGTSMGGPTGGIIGGLAGRAFREITGVGDYHMTNVQTPMIRSQGIAGMATAGNTFLIRHREFVADIVEPANNAGGFSTRILTLNAGNSNLFPWLWSLASLFDQYRIRAMVFHYKPTSSFINGAGTGQGLGVVIMATDYDVSDAIFNSKQQMEATQFSTSCVPHQEMIHPIECKRSQTTIPVLYVRNGSVPPGTDPRLYDMGVTVIGTQGVPNNSNVQTLGELWVSYEIELLKPIINPTQSFVSNTGLGADFAFVAANVTAAKLFANSAYGSLDGTTAQYWPGVTFIMNNSAVNTLYVYNSTPIIQHMLIVMNYIGDSTTLTNALPTPTVAGSVTTDNLLFGNGNAINRVAGTVGTNQSLIHLIKITPNSTGTCAYITSATLPANITTATLRIRQFASF